MVSKTAGAGTIVFDLDGTLCTNTFGEYERAEPHAWAIERVNELAAAGYRIVILTARGSATGIDWEERTHEQLARWGVRYDELRLGKPSGDVYVDDRAVHTDSWRRADTFLPPGHPLTADEGLPPAPAPHLAAVAEVGRTFGGRPLRLPEHAGRAAGLARACGIPGPPGGEGLAATVAEVLAERPAEEGDDLVYTISIAPAAHAGLLDAWLDVPGDAPIASQARVSRRRLRDAAGALRPPLTAAGEGPPLLAAATVPLGARAAAASAAGAWPLAVDSGGCVEDALGGTLAIVAGGGLVLSAEPPLGVAATWLAELAAGVGLEVRNEPVALEALRQCAEAAVIGMPFCLLPIARIDEAEIGGGVPGPVSAALTQAWSEAAGLDLAAQLEALGGGR
jgi:branched-subunit amino acid aminotransferase/4-amino-4-deoxychorismate lyase